jgi:hypothetical protein
MVLLNQKSLHEPAYLSAEEKLRCRWWLCLADRVEVVRGQFKGCQGIVNEVMARLVYVSLDPLGWAKECRSD